MSSASEQIATADAPGLKNWAMLIILSLIWGTAFMNVRIALDGYGPMWVAAGRVSLAAIALLVIGRLVGQGLGTIPSRHAWCYAIVFGLSAAAFPFALLSWGQQFVPSAFAGVSMGTVPLLTLLLAAIFTSEAGIGPRRIAGIALGFLGLVALVGPGAFDGTGALTQWGRIACVSSAIFYAISNIVGRIAPPIPPLALATAAMCVSTVVLVPVALVTEGVPVLADQRATLALAWIALGPTALAAAMGIKILQSAGPLFLSLVSYLVPAWSVVFGIAVMGEQLSADIFIALGLILAGIAIAQSRQLLAAIRRN